MGNTFGLTALIFGLICIPVSAAIALIVSISSLYSLLLGIPNIGVLVSIIGFLIPAIAIIFGILGIVKDDSRGKATAGLVLGIVGLTIAIFIRIWFASLLAGLTP